MRSALKDVALEQHTCHIPEIPASPDAGRALDHVLLPLQSASLKGSLQLQTQQQHC